MSHKCAVCGSSFVDNEGDVCDNCLMSLGLGGVVVSNEQKQTKKEKPANSDGDKNTKLEQEHIAYSKTNQESSSQTVESVTTESNSVKYIEGIVKNYKEDGTKISFIERLFRSMFTWTPFVPDGMMQTFQLFDQVDQRNHNQLSQVCQEVIVYGQIISGTIHDNNLIRVWGRRNRHNAIEARRVENMSSGTVIKTRHAIHPLIIWILFIAFWATLSYSIHGLMGDAGTKILSFIDQLPMILLIIGIPIALGFFLIKTIFTSLTFGLYLKIVFLIAAIALAYRFPLLIPLLLVILIIIFLLGRKK